MRCNVKVTVKYEIKCTLNEFYYLYRTEIRAIIQNETLRESHRVSLFHISLRKR